MKQIPRDRAFDDTLALLREGYGFISERCRRLNSDVFATRLMLRRVICLRGAAATEMFYGRDLMTRVGAMPSTALRLLQDKGSVQLLDGAEHRRRKQMFLSILLDMESIERLRDCFRDEWLDALREWERADDVVLFDAVNLVLTRATSKWLGIPLEKNRKELSRELAGMIENAGSFGPRAWTALWRRRRTERYVRNLVERVRADSLAMPDSSPLHAIASHLDIEGRPLSSSDAAVETINIMRPIVAIGRFIVFAAMALHEHPDWRDRFASGDESQLEAFIEEVRRFYPFFPFIGGRARESFEWNGFQFNRGDWILLDLYGTNHDPRSFPKPGNFEPGRDLSWTRYGYDFIPQGGGDPAKTHRCPGEAITVALMMEAVRLLTRDMSYDVTAQELSIPLSRIPTLPRSGFRITNVRNRPCQRSRSPCGA